jgi:hypothetical protein
MVDQDPSLKSYPTAERPQWLINMEKNQELSSNSPVLGAITQAQVNQLLKVILARNVMIRPAFGCLNFHYCIGINNMQRRIHFTPEDNMVIKVLETLKEIEEEVSSGSAK